MIINKFKTKQAHSRCIQYLEVNVGRHRTWRNSETSEVVHVVSVPPRWMNGCRSESIIIIKMHKPRRAAQNKPTRSSTEIPEFLGGAAPDLEPTPVVETRPLLVWRNPLAGRKWTREEESSYFNWINKYLICTQLWLGCKAWHMNMRNKRIATQRFANMHSSINTWTERNKE